MTNEPKLTEQDIADLEAMANEQPERTVLETWREVLARIEVEEQQRIEPGYASRMLARWPRLELHRIPVYYALFNEYLKRYRDVLTEQLRLHPDALDNTGPLGEEDSDAIKNRDIYKEILFGWSIVTATLEAEWNVTDEDAYESLAAQHEAQQFVTGPQGMMQALVSPGVAFQWTDEDQEALNERVVAALEESGE